MSYAVLRSRGAGGTLLLVLALLVAACDRYTAPTSPSTPTSSSPLPVQTVFIPSPATAPASATDPLVGRYSLELKLGSPTGQTCSSVPPSATLRAYTADVVDVGGRYAVRLYDATFLTDGSTVSYGCADPRLPEPRPSACHQILMTGDANSLSLTFAAEDESRGSEIWEALPGGFLAQITGHAAGQVRDGRIEAKGSGGLWYGDGLPASTPRVCQSEDLRLTFTPR